jgi:hypothetical protein
MMCINYCQGRITPIPATFCLRLGVQALIPVTGRVSTAAAVLQRHHL